MIVTQCDLHTPALLKPTDRHTVPVRHSFFCRIVVIAKTVLLAQNQRRSVDFCKKMQGMGTGKAAMTLDVQQPQYMSKWSKTQFYRVYCI